MHGSERRLLVQDAEKPGLPPGAAMRPARRTPAIDYTTLSLLARLLAHRPVHGTPIIQIGACADLVSAPLAQTLAAACACLVGRTLLLEIEPARTVGSLALRNTGPLPDAFLPGLSHYRLGAGLADSDLLYGPQRAEALAMLAEPFRIVIVQAQGPLDAATLALAPLCCCTTLVVQAGITPLASIKAAAASYALAGGNLVGTVLWHEAAPANR